MIPESTPPALSASPIASDPSTVTGVANRSHGRKYQKRNRRRRPTPTGEVVLNTAMKAKDVAAIQDIKVMGKAVEAYESASPSCNHVDRQVLASFSKGIGMSPLPVDDDYILATSWSGLGTAAPVPKSILRRPFSVAIEISSSSGALG